MSIHNEMLQWIRLAVESVLNQSFSDFELITVCDCPEYAEAISYIEGIAAKDPRVKVIVNERILGPTKSFNIAINASSGKYIARMDADDIAVRERFEMQVDFLDGHQDISVCATDTHTINEHGEIIRRNRYRKKRAQVLNVILNSMAHPSVMFRRQILELRKPLYNEDFIYSQDYELWQFLILQGEHFHTLETPLLLYRKSCRQISCAKRRTQVDLFKKAHRSFITTWLISRNIVDKADIYDLKTMLSKASKAFRHISGEDKEYLAHIIYVLYFSLGTYSWIYRFRYLVDCNLIMSHVRFIYTFRLLVSSRTRRDRTGFN